MLKDLRNIFNGVVYGATLIVPGVSATVFAIMLGFYDELIGTINHFREDYRKNTRYIAAFLFGIAVGAVVFSYVVLFFLDRYQFQTMMLFMGLLAGIVPLIAQKANLPFIKGLPMTGKSLKTTKDEPGEKKISLREILLALLFMSALIAVSRFTSATEPEQTDLNGTMNMLLILYVLLAGIINGATLVIPGSSGAFLLLIMGIYPLVIGSISSVGIYLANPGNMTLLTEVAVVLLPFGVGGVIGLLLMARLMEKLMRDYHEAVYASILGLVLGSLVILFLDFAIAGRGLPTPSLLFGVALFCAGCIAADILGKRCDH